MTESEQELKARVEADFKVFEELAANAGIADLLDAYGRYDAVAQQVDLYQSLLNPQPIFFTSDRTAG